MLNNIKNLQQVLLQKIQPKLSREQILWLEKTQIFYNKNLRTTLGRAHLARNLIELNPTLLGLHPNELESTFAHELAHLVAPLIHGRHGAAHQAGWRQVMNEFGYPPERTHRLAVGVLMRSHRVAEKAACGCENVYHDIKPRRLRKMLYGQRRYRCRICRQEIRLLEKIRGV